MGLTGVTLREAVSFCGFHYTFADSIIRYNIFKRKCWPGVFDGETVDSGEK